MTEPIRIANCSGFFGDRMSAAREMVEGGPIDVLTGDWLAELTMLLLFSGLDPVTAFTAIVACVNNIGPGLGAVGPAGNYQALTDFQTWVCTVAMLLGRLELLSLLVMLTPSFWKR